MSSLIPYWFIHLDRGLKQKKAELGSIEMIIICFIILFETNVFMIDV